MAQQPEWLASRGMLCVFYPIRSLTAYQVACGAVEGSFFLRTETGKFRSIALQ